MSADSSEGEVLVDTSARSVTIKVQLPHRVKWPTPETSFQWQRRLVAEANYTLVALDTNVATLILDGEVLVNRPWDVVATLPALTTAVTVAPDFNSISRVKRSKEAHRWLLNNPPPRPALRPKIPNKVVEELKASKQVNCHGWGEPHTFCVWFPARMLSNFHHPQ